MKFLLVSSDIHDDSEVFEKLCKEAENPDCLALLYAGDLDYENYFISSALRNRNFVFLPVSGNCDNRYSVKDAGLNDLPMYRTCSFNGKRFFITHGHLFSDPASAGLDNKDFDVCINGHTHIPLLTEDDAVIYLNPGSPSRPRAYSKPSYAKIYFTKQGSIQVSFSEFKKDSI